MADASSRETKFGYGFLFAGAGLPYLVDKLLGPIVALVVAAACLLLGIGFLVAGHLDAKRTHHHRGLMATIGMFALIGASSGALVGSIVGAIWHLSSKPLQEESKAVEMEAAQRAALRSRLETLNTVETYSLRLVRVNDGFTDQQLIEQLHQRGLASPNVLGMIFDKTGILGRNNTTGKWSIEGKYEAAVDEFLLTGPENRNPTNGPRLIFSNSPALPDSTIALVATVFADFRDYLAQLGLDAPTPMPSIRFDAGSEHGIGSSGSSSPDSHTLSFGNGLLNDPRNIRWGFSGYVFRQILKASPFPRPGNKWLSVSIFQTYFANSCCESEPITPERYEWDKALWQMRGAFGKNFMDNVLAKTLKLFDDGPTSPADENFTAYFRSRFLRGLYAMDVNKFASVDSILKEHGLN
jgi:hypothetical protein